MRKRVFLISWITVLCLAGQIVGGDETSPSGVLPKPTPDRLPRWRGFNLTEKFHRDWNNGPFVEEDFQLIHELGFNFVRLPMDYRVWTIGDDWRRFDEPTLEEIDQAIAWGEEYGIHVCINFHRAPGYTVASPPEPKSLWTDPEARQVCAEHWAMFARRFREIPNQRLSFNLFNEPPELEPAVYLNVVRKIVEAIRREDPDRLIISDGLKWGTQPLVELAEMKIAHATRGYVPMELTHYRASWVHGSDQFPVPKWPVVTAVGMLYGTSKPDLQTPLVIDGPFDQSTRLRLRVGTGCRNENGRIVFTGAERLDRDWLKHEMIRPWREAEAKGIGVVVGEFGAFNRTSHAVTLAWMEDCLENWREAGWGWALWNFRGSFGVLDSSRKDVEYEDFHGHKLDRKMLDLLQRY